MYSYENFRATISNQILLMLIDPNWPFTSLELAPVAEDRNLSCVFAEEDEARAGPGPRC